MTTRELMSTDNIEITDIFALKILANFNAYGDFQNIARFYIGSALYMQNGDHLTISGDADIDFVRFIKPRAISCLEHTATKLNLKTIQQGEVMEKQLKSDISPLPKIYSEDIKSLFAILSECGMADNYEDFMLDLSHKLRRGLASYDIIDDKSCAISSYVTDEFAVLTALATSPKYRNQKLATRALNKLETKLNGRKILLMKEKDKNNGFYEKHGYKITDNWIIGEL